MSKTCYGCPYYERFDSYFGGCKYGGCMETLLAIRPPAKAIPASGGILVSPDETDREIWEEN